MSYHDQALVVTLVGYVIKAVASGVLAGAVWGALFKIKARPGE